MSRLELNEKKCEKKWSKEAHIRIRRTRRTKAASRRIGYGTLKAVKENMRSMRAVAGMVTGVAWACMAGRRAKQDTSRVIVRKVTRVKEKGNMAQADRKVKQNQITNRIKRAGDTAVTPHYQSIGLTDIKETEAGEKDQV